jgi:hypothetical protein
MLESAEVYTNCGRGPIDGGNRGFGEVNLVSHGRFLLYPQSNSRSLQQGRGTRAAVGGVSLGGQAQC